MALVPSDATVEDGKLAPKLHEQTFVTEETTTVTVKSIISMEQAIPLPEVATREDVAVHKNVSQEDGKAVRPTQSPPPKSVTEKTMIVMVL